MASNILKEYLVKLGFDADQQAFGRMTGMLAAADRAVDLHATGMVKSLVGAQSAILGMFTATSAAIVGMMDKVAMADQGYRLYGLRMLMTTESARKLDMITKALGVDLATIVWDKESHERAVIMAQDMDLMKEKLGPNYEANMKGIRDLGFEFKRLELAGKFLGMSFVSKLFEKLDLGDVGDKLKNWVEWIQDHIPEIADKLSTYAVPVLRKTWEILEAVVEAGKGFCVMFTNLVGLLSGDKSIQGTAFSFDNLATSISHVGDWMVKFFKWMATAETMLAHFFSALSLAISGEFAAASKEFLAGLNDMGANVSGALGGAIYGAIGGSVIPGVGTVGGAIAGGVAGYAVSLTRELVEGPKPEEAPVDQRDRSFLERFPGPPGAAQAVPAAREPAQGQGVAPAAMVRTEQAPAVKSHGLMDMLLSAATLGLMPLVVESKGQAPAPAALPAPGGRDLSRADLVAAIQATADKYDVPRSLALAVAQQESGVNQNPGMGKAGAIGVMQLMPATAAGLGVDPKDATENIDGGVRYLREMLDRYHGDTAKALAAYNAGPGRVDKARSAQDLPPETRAYVPSVLRIDSQMAAWERSQERQAAPAAAVQPSAPVASAQPAPVTAGQPIPVASAERQSAAAPILFAASIPQDTYTSRLMTPPAAQNWPPEKVSAPDVLARDWSPTLASMQAAPAPPAQVANHHQETSVDVGGIYITEPGADAHAIQRAVAGGIQEALAHQTRYDLTQLSPTFA